MLAQPVTFGAVADALSEQRVTGASHYQLVTTQVTKPTLKILFLMYLLVKKPVCLA
jgi:hypothetical protein